MEKEQLLKMNNHSTNVPDLAEQKQAEEALHRRAEQFRTLAENSPDVIARFNRELQYVYINRAVEQIRGVPPEVIIGKNIAELGLPEEVYRLWEQKLKHVFETGEKTVTEYSLPSTKGLGYYQAYAVPEYGEDGSIQSVIAVTRDITELKRSEEERTKLLVQEQAAAQALTALNQLKDLFISVASHELRSPLTAAKGYIQLVQRSLGRQLQNQSGPDEPVVTKNLESLGLVSYQLDRMEMLINQLLDFSRMQNNKLELHYSAGANLAGLVRRVVEQQQRVTPDHRLHFNSTEETLSADFDEARLEQVLTNLITNAVKYSPAETTVTIRIEKQISPPTPDSPFPNATEVVISVQDEGYGIPPEDQLHIFERFYRARNGETRAEGLGLGLYISHEIVVQHGGRIWLESRPEQGSTFYFSLPLAS